MVSVIAADSVESFVIAAYAATVRKTSLVQTWNAISPDFRRDFEPVHTLEIVISDVPRVPATNDEDVFKIQGNQAGLCPCKYGPSHMFKNWFIRLCSKVCDTDESGLPTFVPKAVEVVEDLNSDQVVEATILIACLEEDDFLCLLAVTDDRVGEFDVLAHGPGEMNGISWQGNSCLSPTYCGIV